MPSHLDFEDGVDMTVRVVRFKISDNGKESYETLATSLPEDEFPITVLKYLYHLRWGIESSFRELKYVTALQNLHSHRFELVAQEIWARLCLYDFCERITMHVVIEQAGDRKYMYVANHTMAVNICVDYYRKIGTDADPPPEKEIKRYILPERPNRADRRKVTVKQATPFLYRVA